MINHQPQAFTLIELLVVISIIALLMGLAFPAFQGVQDAAKKTQAKNDLVQIVTGVNAFYTEYGRYPTAETTDTAALVRPDGDNGKICKELQAQGAIINTRQIVFLSLPQAKDQANPRSGVQSSTGKLFDPFGKTYGIAMDADYDNDLANPYDPDSGAGSDKLRQGVLAWSLGKDLDGGSGNKNSGKSKDDILSWQ